MSISVLNTDAGLTGKTLQDLESTQTVIGAKTFDRDPNPPFVVTSGSAVVPNLDADKVDGKDATAFLLLDGTQAMTAGITFPAVQNASSNVNTLDDYEEGSWTPVIGGSGGTTGQSYTTQVGTYVKIGRLVMASFNVLLSSKGTITTNVQIQGLPFAADSTTGYFSIGSVQWIGTATSQVLIIAQVAASSSAATLLGQTAAAATQVALATADIANTTQFIGTILYRASA